MHQGHRGRGIGSWLADWLEECARCHGGSVVGQTVPADSESERFLQQRGYTEGWTSWVLQVPADRAIEPQPLPPAYTLRDYVPGAVDEVVFRLVDEAFNEWPDRQPSTLDDWAARAIRRPGFEPWQMRLAEDGSGVAVGAAYTILAGDCAYVDRLPFGGNSVGWDWPARSWPMPSSGPEHAGRPAASSRPTAEPERWACTSTSGWS